MICPHVGSQCSHLVHSVGDMKLIEIQYKLKIQTGKVSPYIEWKKNWLAFVFDPRWQGQLPQKVS